MSNEKKDDSIGAVWINRTQRGTPYYSVNFNDVGYKIFDNRNSKKSDNSPDFKIYRDDQRGSTGVERAETFDKSDVPF